jgi:AraC family transcriptional regulator of adaptative response / DNA-3-methyladenine glycosylase II
VSATYAPASATRSGVIGQHRRAANASSRTRSPSGADGSAADAEMVRFGIQWIVDGALDADNGGKLASRLGVTHRQLRRLFQTHAGITPDQLARSRRAHLALRMLDDTDLPVADIVFASGFGSTRQFNRTMYDIFRITPLALRTRRRRGDQLVIDGGLVVRLGSSSELEWNATVACLATRAIAGVETIDRDAYRRTVVINGDVGALEIRRDRSGDVLMRALLPQWRDLLDVIQRARTVFNLDLHVETADDVPDRNSDARCSGAWDPFEAGVRAIVGQGRDDDAARALTSRIVEEYGQPAPGLADWRLTHVFPSVEMLARAEFDGIGLTTSEICTLRTFADALLDSDIRTNGCAPDGDAVIASLLATPGIDRTTVDDVALRVNESGGEVPDRWVPQGGLRQLLGQRRRSQTIRLNNSDTQSAKWESPIATRSY